MQKLLQDIRNDLENEAGATFQDDDMMYKEYEKWCRASLEDYGDHVYGHLASWSTYNNWVRSQKDGRASVCCLGGFEKVLLPKHNHFHTEFYW